MSLSTILRASSGAAPCAGVSMRADFDSLVAAAARGDRDAYGELVADSAGLVSSLSLAIVRDVELSRDVAQEVFLAVWRDLKNLRNPASFLPWLRQTARNRAHAALRTRIRCRRLGESGLDAALAQAADPQPNAAQRLANDETERALSDAIEALPDETREVVILFYREGESVARVASLLELSETAVKKRLSRAREKLRADVQERLGETVRRTNPGADFVAVVIAALPVASTPAAAGVSVASASKAAGWGALKLLLSPGWLLGAAGGALGVLVSAHFLLRDARDETERRALKRHTWVSLAAVALWAAALTPVVSLTHASLAAILVWFVGLLGTLAALQHIWLPRILRARFEAEMQEDPVKAAAKRRAGRRMALLGWSAGIAMGSLGIAIGFWFSK